MVPTAMILDQTMVDIQKACPEAARITDKFSPSSCYRRQPCANETDFLAISSEQSLVRYNTTLIEQDNSQ